jgi:hypothetical protein
MNLDLERALNQYAKENNITTEEAAEQILSSFLIAAGHLKRPKEHDEKIMRTGRI